MGEHLGQISISVKPLSKPESSKIKVVDPKTQFVASLPEPDSSELLFATWESSDGDVNPRLILLNPFIVKVTGIAD